MMKLLAPHSRWLVLAAMAGVVGCWWQHRRARRSLTLARGAMAAAAGALTLSPLWGARRRRFGLLRLHAAFGAGAMAGGDGFEAALDAAKTIRKLGLRPKNIAERKWRWIG